MSQFHFANVRRYAFPQDRPRGAIGTHRETKGEGPKVTTPCRYLCELPAAFTLAPPAG
jgi:hypothetical protein